MEDVVSLVLRISRGMNGRLLFLLLGAQAREAILSVLEPVVWGIIGLAMTIEEVSTGVGKVVGSWARKGAQGAGGVDVVSLTSFFSLSIWV